ncbi:MAG TPA: ABC transporter permease [Anaerolineae bacterium]|nr:ABC transporter permease [Anaerolineae bacterium]MCB0224081.1 ABC transporter permease [Anaerolineae bacterium]HRV93485.1 ABC transporter permease [Anaerolineae bacterium]
MTEITQFFIRLSAFLGREIFAVLRQPMLILTLVLGPFLILLLFGLGFNNQAQPLRTLFVIDDENSELAQNLEETVSTLGPQLIYEGITTDKAKAVEKLLRREIDLIAEVPAHAEELIRNNQPAVITLLHYEIDPMQKDYISVFGEVYINEINRRVLLEATQQGQQESTAVQQSLETTKQTAANLNQALELQDQQRVQQEQQVLERDTDILIQTVGASMGLVNGFNQAMGYEDNSETAAIEDLLNDIDQNSQANSSEIGGTQEVTAEKQRLTQLEGDLDELDTLLQEFQTIDPNILVRPFRSEPKSIVSTELRPSDFFAPAVIALLMQHLAVTFAALSVVTERRAGTMELFRISPISPIETLLSKYLSYLLLAGLLTAVLTIVVVYGLGVPMLGPWSLYVLIMAALIFTSLGIGFVISLVAKTDSQAVQYSMILLLTSVFFSGAFIGLHLLRGPVKIVSWAIPATYGIRLLQDIMLRGYLVNTLLLSGLTAIGVVFFLLAWFMMRRAMAQA